MSIRHDFILTAALVLVAGCSADPGADPDDSSSAQALGGDACCSTAPALVTWDPSAKGPMITVSDGDLSAGDIVQQVRGSTRATFPRCSGKWYWEIVLNDDIPGATWNYAVVGVGTAAAPLSDYYIGGDANGWAYFPANAEKMHDAQHGGFGPYGNPQDYGEPRDVIGVALDIDGHTLEFFKNGVSLGVAYGDLPSDVPLYPMVGTADVYFSATARFAAPFTYAPPPGFSAYGGVTPTTWDASQKGPMISLSPAGFIASDVQQQVRGSTRATRAKTSGKWYWEVKIEDQFPGYATWNYPVIGVGTAAAPLSGEYIGGTAAGWAYFPANSEWMHDAQHGGYGQYGDYANIGDTIGVALDIDGHTLTFYKNGATLGPAYSDIPSGTPIYPMVGTADLYFKTSARFAAPFKYTPPYGFAPFDGTVARCGD